jgi:carbamoyltransferase
MLVLGLNHSNDAAACIVRDGEILGAAQEERFTRQKHDRNFPTHAVSFCLKRAGAKLADVDAVAFFWNPGIHAEVYNHRQSAVPRHHLEYLSSVPNHLLRGFGGDGVAHVEQRFTMKSGKALDIHYVTHHLCHAASTLFQAPFEEGALLTVDGYGERASTHLAVGHGLSIETLLTVEFPHSVGSLYAAVTEHLGFRANSGEGKVMGLSAYGQPRYASQLRELVELGDFGFRLDLRAFSYFVERSSRVSPEFTARFGPARAPESALAQHHYDLAASLQLVTEEILLHLAALAKQRTGMKHLGMAGGVVLNCVANGRIARESGFDSCFFQPAAGDAGTSLGAALWVTHGVKKLPRRRELETVDTLGVEHDDAEITAELDRAKLPSQRLKNAPAAAAHLISEGKIIGWVQGRAEFGPRALGNRSILADPRRAEMKDIVNRRVKFREPFRPFAPSVLVERCGELFEPATPSPFMLRAQITRPEKREVVPAITHVDGTARVQTVTKTSNPRYYALIEAFAAKTGVPCVLNTSFNVRGEPIVNTVADALRCFFTTDMDALFLGDHVLVRDEALRPILAAYA